MKEKRKTTDNTRVCGIINPQKSTLKPHIHQPLKLNRLIRWRSEAERHPGRKEGGKDSKLIIEIEPLNQIFTEFFKQIIQTFLS